MEIDKTYIYDLKLQVTAYEAITKAGSAQRNRFRAMWIGENPDNDEIVKAIDSLKDSFSRRIAKTIKNWPIWEEWLDKVSGIGPAIGGRLILMYYYRFTPICPKCSGDIDKVEGTYFCPACDKSLKGDGNLVFRIDERDFPKISAWWAYMGRHNNGNGTMPKRKAGEQANWSTKGRTLGFHIADQFNRQKPEHPYKKIFLDKKMKHQTLNKGREKEWTKMHIHNAAGNETVKIFLAHFWTVARELAGKEVTKPYVGRLQGHTVIPPFFWKKPKEM